MQYAKLSDSNQHKFSRDFNQFAGLSYMDFDFKSSYYIHGCESGTFIVSSCLNKPFLPAH